MKMGMSLMQAPLQLQRQDLEQRLEQRLEQQISQKLSLDLHLKTEGIIESFVNYADQNQTWREFNKDGFKFSYAGLPYDLAKPIADEYGMGFSHCVFNPWDRLLVGKQYALDRGQWLLFLVEDKIPQEFHDFTAIHERGEELSLGDHYFASQLEFAYAQAKKQMKEYAKHIDKTSPRKFVDLTQKVLFPILPDELREFNEVSLRGDITLGMVQKVKERETAIDLIGKYPLPTGVLRKMDKYATVTEDLIYTFGDLNALINDQVRLWGQSAGYARILGREVEQVSPEKVAQFVNDAFSIRFRSIRPKQLRVASMFSVEDAFGKFVGEMKKVIGDYSGKKFEFPSSFEKAYELAKKKKAVVRVESQS